jgi:hypothetical protein
MTEEIKQEALEQIELDVKFGFENEEELFTSIREMFYNEENFDERWLRDTISERYKKHQLDSSAWKHPTDFERLAKAFDELIDEKIVCLHNAGFTKSDGVDDCVQVIERLEEIGISAIGFCYYHSQDLTRAVDANSRDLLVGFGVAVRDDDLALSVGRRIADKLKQHGFQVNWSETIEQRIEIQNIDWKKIPDEQDWHGERVIQRLSKRNGGGKPFWKLW